MEQGRDEPKVDNFRGEAPTVTRVREGTRQTLAYRLLWLFAAEVAAILLAVIFHRITIDVAKDIALAVIVPTTSILAIVVGFFFGEGNR